MTINAMYFVLGIMIAAASWWIYFLRITDPSDEGDNKDAAYITEEQSNFEPKFKIDDMVMLEYREGKFMSCTIKSIEAQVLGVQWYEVDIYGKLCPFGVAPETMLSASTSTPPQDTV